MIDELDRFDIIPIANLCQLFFKIFNSFSNLFSSVKSFKKKIYVQSPIL